MQSSRNPIGNVGFSGELKIKVKRTWRSKLIYYKQNLISAIKAIPKYLHQTV